MERRSRKKSETYTKDEIKKYARFLAVPLMVLVLVLVIVFAGNGRPGGKKGSGTVGSSEETTSGAETAGQEFMDLTGYQLAKDEVPELTALVQAYCQAKLEGDPVARERLFGRTEVTQQELEASRARMERVRQMVDGYENISCYSVEGPKPDTYVIYPYFEIRYKGAEAVVPVVAWSYAKKNPEGQFYMTQDVSEKEADYIAGVSELEDVRNLAAEVEANKAKAIAGDAVLHQIYLGTGSDSADPGTTDAETDAEGIMDAEGTNPEVTDPGVTDAKTTSGPEEASETATVS